MERAASSCRTSGEVFDNYSGRPTASTELDCFARDVDDSNDKSISLDPHSDRLRRTSSTENVGCPSIRQVTILWSVSDDCMGVRRRMTRFQVFGMIGQMWRDSGIVNAWHKMTMLDSIMDAISRS